MTNGFTTMELRDDSLITMRHGPSREKMRGEKKKQNKNKKYSKKTNLPLYIFGY